MKSDMIVWINKKKLCNAIDKASYHKANNVTITLRYIFSPAQTNGWLSLKCLQWIYIEFDFFQYIYTGIKWGKYQNACILFIKSLEWKFQ